VTDLQIIIGKTVEDKLYFRVLTEGGRILFTSRDYGHIEKCMNEIYAIQTYKYFVITEDFVKNHGYQYALLTEEGRVIGTSRYYSSAHGMRYDISIFTKHVGKAEVIDTSALITFFRPVRIK
jgi:hypothetical protein